MKNSQKWLRWAVRLWKRLYKKATFLVLLVMIPALVFAYGLVSRQDSGMVTIALATQGSQVDPLTRVLWEDLKENRMILYMECESPEQARELVRSGKANTAWIFEADLEARIYDFVANRGRNSAFVTVVEPENRVLLKLLREVLSGTVFPYCSETVYLTYIRENAPELDAVSDETLLSYYHNAGFEDGLFVITDMEGNVLQSEEDEGYLLTPVRGMLAVVAMLSGLAAAMYYIRDEENGTFAWMSQRRKPWMELGCQLISVSNVLLVVLLALALTGQVSHWGREVVLTMLYSLCVAAFAMLVRRLSGGIRGLGMVTPILVVVMLVTCPVFFDLGMLRRLQLLLPPTYYIVAVHNTTYLWYMLAHTALALLLCRLWDRVRFGE